MEAVKKKMRNVVSRFLSAAGDKEPPNLEPFSISDRQISNLQLLQRKNSDTLGKVGMLSWVGEMGDSRVKVYECRSIGQAKFIEKLSHDERVKKYLPRCYHREREFLVVEWVEGKSVAWDDLIADPKLMHMMTAVHCAFHSQVIEYWPDEKCYFFDYLENRFNRFRNVLPLDDFVSKVLCILEDDKPQCGLRLSHPDVTPVNVIIDDSGTFKAIDNDLITQTSYYLVDLFTTHRSMRDLPSGVLVDYLKSYCHNGGNLQPLVDNESFYNALWTYRMVGTCLQEGLIQQGLDLANDFVRSGGSVHPVITAIKKEKLY